MLAFAVFMVPPILIGFLIFLTLKTARDSSSSNKPQLTAQEKQKSAVQFIIGLVVGAAFVAAMFLLVNQ